MSFVHEYVLWYVLYDLLWLWCSNNVLLAPATFDKLVEEEGSDGLTSPL